MEDPKLREMQDKMSPVTDLRGRNARPRPADHLAPGGKPRDEPEAKSSSISFVGAPAGPWAMVDAPTGTILVLGFGPANYQVMLVLAKIAAAGLAGGLLPERIKAICEEAAVQVRAELMGE